MKILTSMYTLKKGGAYDRFIMMVEALLEHRCEVHCLSLTPIPINHPCYRNHFVAVPLGGKRELLAKLIVLLMFPWFSLLIGWREKADLFVSFGPLYAFLQAMPKWILQKPMITLIRLNISLTFKKKELLKPATFLEKGIEYAGLSFSDRIITLNSAMKDEIIRVIGRRKRIEVKVLFNNIPEMEKPTPEDIARERERIGIPRGAKLLVTAGVLTPRKNIEILLRGFSKLRRDDLFLLVVGDSTEKRCSPYRDTLEASIKKLDLTRKVALTKWLAKEELWKILGGADLFVLPSLREGMPNVMLEALGVDLPCIGSNIPGIQEILHHESLMFDPIDVNALAQKIIRFFSERDFAVLISQLCLERKQKFSFDWKAKVFEMITKRSSGV